MAKFYGTLVGARDSVATKTGTTNTGIRATVQSWDGSVITRLGYDEEDRLIVRVEIGSGSTTYGDTVFRGTIEELYAKLTAK